MRVLACTVVHHPEDARVLHREIRALLDAGHEVTYAAPFHACAVTPWPELSGVDVPRAAGRSRLRALMGARRALAEHAPHADIVVLYNPELLLALPGQRGLPPVVWDVQEDTAAALSMKPWLPAALRPVLRRAVRTAEFAAERRIHLMLAEDGYRDRFRLPHPVVPNTTYVPEAPPPPGDDRVVYLGHLSRARGAADMVATARRLHGHGVRVELIGGADDEVTPMVSEAHARGVLRWHGFVPNDEALRLVEGALAGLSLLHDEPNYRHSQPTKVMEYVAHGIPVITTPLPRAAELVERHRAGLVVPFEAPDAAVEAVLRLRDDPELRAAMARSGHEAARALYHWPNDAAAFVAQLEKWAHR